MLTRIISTGHFSSHFPLAAFKRERIPINNTFQVYKEIIDIYVPELILPTGLRNLVNIYHFRLSYLVFYLSFILMAGIFPNFGVSLFIINLLFGAFFKNANKRVEGQDIYKKNIFN